MYFYRGTVDNNVIFGGFCWKIIRTTETKGVKLIYNGTPSNGICNNSRTSSQIGTSAYNSLYNNNAYVGYMYGSAGVSTYTTAHANTNNSTIKTILDNWYKNYLLLYASYIEDTVYCNDRNTTSGTNSTLGSDYGTLGYGQNSTAYAASRRSSNLTTSANPTLVCKNTQGSVASNNDAFTVSSSLGNGKLTYPVGLITTDEAVLAGIIGRNMNTSNFEDSTNYLYTGEWFWSMTPIYANTYARVGIVNSSVGFNGVHSVYGVRPVISLKQGTKVTGAGTLENPYVVE